MLTTLNAHPRDAFISFEEGPHIYTVHGKQGFTSVTTWNHHHFPAFDPEKTVDGIMNNKKKNDPTYKYYGMSREEILNNWKLNGDNASKAGTKMHYDVECYYNGLSVVNESIEYTYFQDFLRDFGKLHPGNVRPYRTEWMVYWEELKLSGSIDMVFENPDGTLLIYDWKRVQEIVHENGFGKHALTDCISHLPDTNFWHYSLQLNMYKAILENKYNKKVVGLFLVALHPDNYNHSYIRVEAHDLSNEIAELLKVREKEVAEMEI